MRVLVCGGRDFGNIRDKNRPDYKERLAEYKFGYDTLTEMSVYDWPKTEDDKFGNWLPAVTIISGEADGADSIATDWAVINWTGYEGYPADWKTHGKAAGYIRNKQMLEEGKPDLVIAFPGGRGTAMMVDIAKKAGVEVIEIEYNARETQSA